MRLYMIIWITLCVSGAQAKGATGRNKLLNLMYRLVTYQQKIMVSVADARTESKYKQEEMQEAMQGQINRIIESVADARRESKHKQEVMQEQINRILGSPADDRIESEHTQGQINKILQSEHRQEMMHEQIDKILISVADARTDGEHKQEAMQEAMLEQINNILESVADARTESEDKQEVMQEQIDKILKSVADARTESEHKQEVMQEQIDKILKSVAYARTESEKKQEVIQEQINKTLESVADARTESEDKQEEVQEQIDKVLESVADARTESEHKQETMQEQINKILESVADDRTESEHKQEAMQENINKILKSVADARTESENKQKEVKEAMQEQINRILESSTGQKKAANELIGNQADRLELEIRQRNTKTEGLIKMLHHELLCMYPPHCYKGIQGIITIVTGCHNGPFADIRSKDIYCDAESDGGGWLVFQKRFDGSVNFNRTWNDYKNGFGDLNGEFWLGLEAMHELTQQQNMELRVDMEDFDGKKAYAVFKEFKIFSEADQYAIRLGGYMGNAGATMWFNNAHFVTIDRVSVCVRKYGVLGWWDTAHCVGDPNGSHFPSTTSKKWTWEYWWRSENLRSTEMKMRPVSF